MLGDGLEGWVGETVGRGTEQRATIEERWGHDRHQGSYQRTGLGMTLEEVGAGYILVRTETTAGFFHMVSRPAKMQW